MAKVHSGEEILPNGSPLSRVHQRYRQTTDRQDDRRICDSKDPNVT